jgi:ubiquinone biosynthesis protein UbiJ
VPGLLADPSRWNELVRETGDAQLGGALKDIAQTTPWFVEKLLGDALGPIAGQRVADLGRSLLQFPAYAAERLTDSAVSYARDEAELLAPAAAMRRFTADVAAVEGAVDTLAARIAALQERLPQPR